MSCFDRRILRPKHAESTLDGDATPSGITTKRRITRNAHMQWFLLPVVLVALLLTGAWYCLWLLVPRGSLIRGRDVYLRKRTRGNIVHGRDRQVSLRRIPTEQDGWRYLGDVPLGAFPIPIDEFIRLWAPPPLTHPTRLFPKLVHQSWKSTTPPVKLQPFIESWLVMQPDWEYVLHSDLANAELVATHYPWLAKLFLSITGIQRADVSRLLYMHAYGGVYADLDVELLKPLQPLLDALLRSGSSSAIIGQEPLAHSVLLESKPRQCCNAVLASARGHPFWLWALQQIAAQQQAAPDSDPVGSTGPRMLEGLVNQWQAASQGTRAALVVAAPETFFPTWDPMQENAFREHCAAWAATINGTTVDPQRPAELRESAQRVCEALNRDGFKPTVPADGSAFTNHHWVHTWIDETPSAYTEPWGGSTNEDYERVIAAFAKLNASTLDLPHRLFTTEAPRTAQPAQATDGQRALNGTHDRMGTPRDSQRVSRGFHARSAPPIQEPIVSGVEYGRRSLPAKVSV